MFTYIETHLIFILVPYWSQYDIHYISFSCLPSEGFQLFHMFIVSIMFITPVNRMWMIEKKRCQEVKKCIRLNMQSEIGGKMMAIAELRLIMSFLSVLCSLIALKSWWLDLVRSERVFVPDWFPLGPKYKTKYKDWAQEGHKGVFSGFLMGSVKELGMSQRAVGWEAGPWCSPS